MLIMFGGKLVCLMMIFLSVVVYYGVLGVGFKMMVLFVVSVGFSLVRLIWCGKFYGVMVLMILMVFCVRVCWVVMFNGDVLLRFCFYG